MMMSEEAPRVVVHSVAAVKWRASLLAFACCEHARLGAGSPARCLTRDCVGRICAMAAATGNCDDVDDQHDACVEREWPGGAHPAGANPFADRNLAHKKQKNLKNT
eukprot:TRINITY_DN3690_c0_g2_i3.p1 TRINITY_DN3690_c0_g2~~TRINITY_DN3690_c0_g2_i3.p1  ORF type:complete len:113 (+),score=29.31 TRINITY_DN3690_c0_g2_i3:24-341(+)